MPMIEFTKNYPAIQVDRDANLMASLLKAGLPVASSCRGDGVCGKCRVMVVAGRQNLSPETNLEAGLRLRQAFPPDERLSCQALVLGDVTVDTGYW